MSALLQDLRFAIRMLRKSPATTVISLATLAVAIGASTSIFSLVSAMLVRPLPFPGASRLVGVASAAPGIVEPADLWIPLERKLPWRNRGTHYLDTVARLKSGVSIDRAKADLAAAMPRIASAAKATHLASMQPLQRFLRG